MHGGLKIYRGAAAAARQYVEADRSRADDYYLAEGIGLAQHFVASPDRIEQLPDLDGDRYEDWVAGINVDTGAPKGRLRTDAQAVRFVEVTVNGPKTWSLAAALHPEIAEAYDAAQQQAATEIIQWIAQHATTRIGPRGRQVQVPVDEIEAAVVRHFTSRAGDPHRHLHLQINARVSAAGSWRGIHTVGVRDSLEAINGIGHAAVMTDPRFRGTLAAYGYTLDHDSAEVSELVGYAGAFSARSRQIETNIDAYEATWRSEHPGEEPGPTLRQAWDRRAWADARPDKVVPVSGSDLQRRWVEELHELGFRERRHQAADASRPVGRLNREAMVDQALTHLGARRSAWNAADVRGEVEKLIASAGVVVGPAVRREVAEDLAARVVERSRPLLDRADVPEHVRALTSSRVLAVEQELAERISERARKGSILIWEGPAGSGKTRRLAALREAEEARRGRLFVVTPTRRAAQVAAREVGARAQTVAWLLHRHGYRWNEGEWSPVEPASDAPHLTRRWVLAVDEAGMLDQDTARALFELADSLGTRVLLLGDRHQLPAIGRGGVLDLAARYAPDRCTELEGVRRFADPEYADLTLRMRKAERPEAVFDTLLERGEIVLHASDVERAQALARHARSGELVIADTREQVARLNGLVHRARVKGGEATDAFVTAGGERIGVGDTVVTRHNDSGNDVANRDSWSVVAIDAGGVTVEGESGRRILAHEYVHEHVELGYATTAHGAQGMTVSIGHVLVGDHSGAASTYVGMTRGRDRNVAHLIADSADDARRQWVNVFGRDRADLGPEHAGFRAAEDIERFGGRRSGVRRPYAVDRESLERGRRPTPERGPGLGM